MNRIQHKKLPRRRKSRTFRRIGLPMGITIILIVLMVIIHLSIDGTFPDPREKSEPTYPYLDTLKNTLKNVFISHGVAWNSRTERGTGAEFWVIRIPPDLPLPSLHLAIQEAVIRHEARILEGKSEPISGQLDMKIGWQDSCLLTLYLNRASDIGNFKGKLALIVDDFGDRWDDVIESFMDLRGALSYSILPGRKYSRRMAREMVKRGCEVILHLPMEAIQYEYPDKRYLIQESMKREEIRRIMQRAIEDVPGVVGMNNHMGSKVTSNRELMTVVLEFLKEKGLYFVDSRTTSSTVAYDVARSMGLRCSQRDVFLDVEMDRENIKQKFSELTQKALQNGFACGIGHCHRITLEVLREEIPRLEAAGYRFVPVSGVIR